MADVAANDKRRIEEDVLGFFLGNLMSVPVFLSVGIVPIKAGTFIQRVFTCRHDHQYTMDIYQSIFVPKQCET